MGWGRQIETTEMTPNPTSETESTRPPAPNLEICIDCPASARAAGEGGADRVELCANLPDGGTTPSLGTIRAVRRVFGGGLMVIIRPRGGDFLFDPDEIAEMLDDIQAARDAGADGVVIGCLTAEGAVDTELCARLVEAAGPLDITFHRAFDMSRDLDEALDAIASLGIARILTSGGAPDVPGGIGRLAALVKRASGRVSIMPGGGVVPENVGEIVRATGVREIHLSARSECESAMQFRNEACSMGAFTAGREYKLKTADPEKVRAARQALDAAAGRV
jgi:copper homeostasis protein